MAKASKKKTKTTKKNDQIITGSFDDVLSASVKNIGKQPQKQIKKK